MARPGRTVALILAGTLLAAACATSLEIEVSPRPAPPEGVDGDASGSNPDESGGPAEPTPDETAGQVAMAGDRVAWAEADCEFIEPVGVTTDCGWLQVPERWDLEDDPDTIRLHVGIFSTGATDTEPIVYLEGGPGGDALANIAQSFDTIFGELAAAHDIVIIGQRGTGSAEPALDCGNVTDLQVDLLDESQATEVELDLLTDALGQCADMFRADDIDTAAYNSVQNANDVDALRMALGYDAWNVLGISYGTRLAQTLMRLHPDGVRAAILDSVLPYEREPNLDIPIVAERAFGVLFEGCAASTVCSGAYPDLETRYFAQVDRLDTQPVDITVSDVFTSEQYPALVDGQALLDTTFGALYSKSAFSALPELVGQLERGETSGLETLVSQEVTSWPFIADGMYWSVQCHEEVPFLEPDAAAAGRTGDPRYDRFAPDGTDQFLDTICTSFQAGEAEPAEDQQLVSDIPTLLLAGTYDPITPPSDTESLLAGLSNAVYVELPHTGHAALADECAQQIALDFVADPGAAPDTSCVADIEEPDWVPDVFADVAFESFEYDSGFVSGSGVAPVGWESGGDGSFVQADNVLHLSVILQQAVAGVPADFLVENLSGFLGTEPVPLGPMPVGPRTWSQYEAPVPGSIIDIFVVEDGADTLLVLFQHAPADRERALAVLAEPVLEAFGP